MKLNQLLLAGIAGLAFSEAVRADVTLVITGGNASRGVVYDRAAAILTGETVVNGANQNLRSFLNGTIAGQPGLGNVTIHFVLNGASQGLQDLRDQVNVPTTSGPLPAQLAISGNFPETIGIDSSIFTSQRTLVVPFGFIKNDLLPNTLHGVTNLTQRQAAFLQAASGTLPTAFFGGESTTDILYIVGRNTGAAVRQVIDANIYFTGTPSFYTTNASGLPILHPGGGGASGQNVTNDLNVIPNAIGTVSAGDIGNYTPLSYEGVAPTAANVANGSYPIWGYEAWYSKNSGAGQPSANQLVVINALLTAVTDTTFQHTPGNVFSNSRFVPIGDLEVERTADGGPITSTLY